MLDVLLMPVIDDLADTMLAPLSLNTDSSVKFD
jgi:hypothetical protein